MKILQNKNKVKPLISKKNILFHFLRVGIGGFEIQGSGLQIRLYLIFLQDWEFLYRGPPRGTLN